MLYRILTWFQNYIVWYILQKHNWTFKIAEALLTPGP